MKYTKVLAAVVLAGLVSLVGCGVSESYNGVPKNGDTCKQAYEVPANQVKCVSEESRH